MPQYKYIDDTTAGKILEFYRTNGRYEVFQIIANGWFSSMELDGHVWNVHTEKQGEQVVSIVRADDASVRINPVLFVSKWLKGHWREKMMERVPEAQTQKWIDTGERDGPVSFWMRINNWDLLLEYTEGRPEELRIEKAEWVDPY
jgi:hypothetical protein